MDAPSRASTSCAFEKWFHPSKSTPTALETSRTSETPDADLASSDDRLFLDDVSDASRLSPFQTPPACAKRGGDSSRDGGAAAGQRQGSGRAAAGQRRGCPAIPLRGIRSRAPWARGMGWGSAVSFTRPPSRRAPGSGATLSATAPPQPNWKPPPPGPGGGACGVWKRKPDCVISGAIVPSSSSRP